MRIVSPELVRVATRRGWRSRTSWLDSVRIITNPGDFQNSITCGFHNDLGKKHDFINRPGDRRLGRAGCGIRQTAGAGWP